MDGQFNLLGELPLEMVKYLFDTFLAQEDKFLLSWTCHTWRNLIREFYDQDCSFSSNDIFCYAVGNGYFDLVRKFEKFSVVEVNEIIDITKIANSLPERLRPTLVISIVNPPDTSDDKIKTCMKINYIDGLNMAAKYHRLKLVEYLWSLILEEYNLTDSYEQLGYGKQILMGRILREILKFSAQSGFITGLKFALDKKCSIYEMGVGFSEAARGRQLKTLEYIQSHTTGQYHTDCCNYPKALLFAIRGIKTEFPILNSAPSFPTVHRDSLVKVMEKLELGNLRYEIKRLELDTFGRGFFLAVSRSQIKAARLLLQWGVSLIHLRIGFRLSVGATILNPDETKLHRLDLLADRDTIPDEKHYRLTNILLNCLWSNDPTIQRNVKYFLEPLVIASAVNRANIFQMINQKLLIVLPNFQSRKKMYQRSIYWAAFHGSLQIIELFNRLGFLTDLGIVKKLIRGAIKGGQIKVIQLIHCLLKPTVGQYHEMMIYLSDKYSEQVLTSKYILGTKPSLKFKYQVENLQVEWIKMATLFRTFGAIDYNQYFQHSVGDNKLKLLRLFKTWDQSSRIDLQTAFNRAASDGQIETLKLVDFWGVGCYLKSLNNVKTGIKRVDQELWVDRSSSWNYGDRTHLDHIQEMKQYQECHKFISSKIQQTHQESHYSKDY